jgi:phosphatidylserine/phosphatidylglycerophosphate/cardiolipin synthase-like enzyme
MPTAKSKSAKPKATRAGARKGAGTSATPAPPEIEPFVWDDLARYKAEKRFLDGYPADQRSFYSPRDKVAPVVASLLASAQHSIVINMYGYDDPQFDELIREKLHSDHVYVQISLDKTEAAGKHEKELLAKWSNTDAGNSIAIGTAEVSHAISHMKVLIVDGVYSVTGSTNWSISGLSEQDNQLTLNRDAVIAAELRAVLDLNHDWMLKQMAKEREEEAAKAGG